MNVKTLISELSKIDGETEVYFKYSYFHCGGHPEGCRCYCSYEDEVKEITSVDLYQNLKVLDKSLKKKPGLVFGGG